jgi:hypothetical protein
MIVSMSPKSYSDGCLNSTSSVRTEFLVGTPAHGGTKYLLMQRSDDREVVNLLQVGFVQDLVRCPKWLATAWERMGPETRRITTDTARAWNREMNLPAAARPGESSKAKAQAQGR